MHNEQSNHMNCQFKSVNLYNMDIMFCNQMLIWFIISSVSLKWYFNKNLSSKTIHGIGISVNHVFMYSWQWVKYIRLYIMQSAILPSIIYNIKYESLSISLRDK